MRILLIEVILI